MAEGVNNRRLESTQERAVSRARLLLDEEIEHVHERARVVAIDLNAEWIVVHRSESSLLDGRFAPAQHTKLERPGASAQRGGSGSSAIAATQSAFTVAIAERPGGLVVTSNSMNPWRWTAPLICSRVMPGTLKLKPLER